jgi:tetratricopeptide (TPR) repeat protein
LPEGERGLFRRLAFFVGGFSLEAAEDVGRETEGGGREEVGSGGPEAADLPVHHPPSSSVLDGVASLVDKSLLRSLPPPAGESDAATPRFEMIETIREFGLEQLAASGEAEVVGRRHAACFLALAEGAEPFMRGPGQIAGLDRLEIELPNLRATLAWLRDAGDAANGLRLAAALWTFWVVHDRVPEGRRWLEEFLASDPAASTGRLKALLALGDLAERQGDNAVAAAWTEEALGLAQVRRDRVAEAAALRGLGNIAIARGEMALRGLGDATLAEAEFVRAEASLEQSSALAREMGDEWGAAKAAYWLAVVCTLRRDGAQAIARLDEALAAFRRLGDHRQLCLVLWNLGAEAHFAGESSRARSAFGESLAFARRLGYRWLGSLCLIGLAAVPSRSGGGGGAWGARGGRLRGGVGRGRRAAAGRGDRRGAGGGISGPRGRPKTGRPRPPLAARAPGLAPAGRGPIRSPDRRRPVRQPAHCGQPRRQRLPQAGRDVACCGGSLRRPSRARLTP